MSIRHMIYKIQLEMSDSSLPLVFLATKNPENIPVLIEKNRMWFEKDGRTIVKWKILQNFPTIALDEERYEFEVSNCDIVDEV